MNQRDFHLNRMQPFLRCRLAEETYRHGNTFRPSLTISRQCGAGTDRIGQKLVEYLDEVDETAVYGWALFDQSLIARIIEDHKLPDSVKPYLTENAKFPVVEALESVLNKRPSEWTLFNYTARTIRNLCHMGNAIIIGRAGNFVTSDLENTFHVRLVASEKARIAHVQARHLLSPHEASKLVTETDRARSKFVKRYVQSSPEDPTTYHLIINTDDMSDEGVIRILADSLLEWANERALKASASNKAATSA